MTLMEVFRTGEKNTKQDKSRTEMTKTMKWFQFDILSIAFAIIFI